MKSHSLLLLSFAVTASDVPDGPSYPDLTTNPTLTPTYSGTSEGLDVTVAVSVVVVVSLLLALAATAVVIAIVVTVQRAKKTRNKYVL